MAAVFASMTRAFGMTEAGGIASVCTGAATGGGWDGGLTLISTLAAGGTCPPPGITVPVPGTAAGGDFVPFGLMFTSTSPPGGGVTVTSTLVGAGIVLSVALGVVPTSARAAVQLRATRPAASRDTLFMIFPPLPLSIDVGIRAPSTRSGTGCQQPR